jgi:hypothetical protein
MITVKMTDIEYKAYLLYLKSIEIMLEVDMGISDDTSIEEYMADPENRKEFETGMEDIKAGRITYIDPENIWGSIK